MDNKKKVIELSVECSDCKGTGLYVGMAEIDGAAMECSTCHGTGEYEFKYGYVPFTNRKIRKGVKRVFKKSCGYVHSAEDVKVGLAPTIEFSKAGASYDEWLAGKDPEPVRELYCPLLWTDQRLQLTNKNGLYKSRCDKGVTLGGSITHCKYYSEKHRCWQIFEGKKT